MAHDELLRIYTPAGEVTDTFRRRSEVHRDGDWHGTIHLWVMNSFAELLFQKRADTAELNPGLWDVSAAGHIVNDDSPELSLEREALEELGITIAAKEVNWLFTLKSESHTDILHERVFQHVYLIKRNIDLTELNLQVEEVAGVAWHHYSILARLREDSTGFVPRLEEYARLSDYLENQRMPQHRIL
jgi:8-oxo-dGTP diphosphatase